MLGKQDTHRLQMISNLKQTVQYAATKLQNLNLLEDVKLLIETIENTADQIDMQKFSY